MESVIPDIRRFFADSYAPGASIIGAPSLPSHLPEAEPILPGHTLLRPALGMLKSAVKFPHKEMDNGAGVYGNIDNLGIKYDGFNERILYTGFRRMPSNYIFVLPQQNKNRKDPNVYVGNIVLDSDIFNTDPKNLEEIMMKRIETERAIQEFFNSAKVRVLLTNSQEHNQFDLDKFSNVPSYDTPEPPKPALRLKMVGEPDDSSSTSSEAHPQFEDLTGVLDTHVEDKKSWFASTKYLFNHVKISNQAPEYSDFLPMSTVDIDNIRSWWYFNQDDFQPFDEPVPKDK